ncbi:hypothetical protein [Nocardioides sp.]|uniref:hypothetical protein n=1 Tax=Nocardioides sp. TaxID=35761 RepID=UPI0031FEC955|nr:hypothetical protein [Nocardioides sp.]
MSTDLLTIADELYALELPEFTPARDARAKELKASDADLSKRVKALKKPSVAAWVVNLLVRHEAEQVEQVLAVGAALREAQASLAGEELRALTRQRRQLTAAVTTQARAVAKDHGTRVTEAVAEQVEATLTAAMVDEDCAKAVRSGLLVTALATTGVGEVDLGGSVAVPEALGFSATPRTDEPAARPELHVVPDPEADQKVVAAAAEKLARAEAGLGEAQEALDEAVGEVETLEARGMQVQAEIDELRRKLVVLEEQYEQVDDELGDAEDVRSEAEKAVTDAIRTRDAAAAALERLKG